MEMIGDFHITGTKVTHTNGTKANDVTGCHLCKNKATVHVTQVSAMGKTTHGAFCILHAISQGLMHPKSWDLLTAAEPLHKPTLATTTSTETTCSCGMTHSLLKSKGRAGCAKCYTVFGSTVKKALPQIHNATAHAGKAPKKAARRVDVRRRVADLQSQMKNAIKAEAYEQAAKVRDQIAQLLTEVK